MRAVVLGSAAGGGFPQWNCNCRMCAGVRSGEIRATPRTQSSIAVTADGTDWILFNASPDLLTQLKATPALQPGRSLRDTGIRTVVLMDAQIDHTTGLLMLREHREPLRIACTDAVAEDLSTGNPLLPVLGHYCGVDRRRIVPGEPFAVDGVGGIELHPIALTSNAPPYSPHRDAPVPGDTLGVTLVDTGTGRRLFYAPGLGEIEPHVREAMRGADVVLVDGTVWTDDEMIRTGASSRTGAAMGHLAQSGPGGMIEELDALPEATRRILIHINNTNPVLDEDGEERATLAAHRIELAHDGMEIVL